MLKELKDIKIKELKEIIELQKEKQELEQPVASLIPYKKFNFLQKHILQRKEYREYLGNKQKAIEEDKKNKEQRSKRLREVKKILLGKGNPSIDQIESKIEEINKATTLEEIGIQNAEEGTKILKQNGMELNFDSCEKAFELAPDVVGKDPEFMKKAIEENIEYIQYDKSNDEELYKIVIDKRIKKLEEDPNIEFDSSKQSEIEDLNKLRKELDDPKEVEEGKYKVPHRFMFEEIRSKIVKEKPQKYYYTEVDGKFNKEFGEELEKLYDDPDILLGVHGSPVEGKDIDSILEKGLRNSSQNADNALNRTVAYGENLTFINTLDYRIFYNGFKSKNAFIITLPKDAVDEKNPSPIWGSHEEKGSDNYILPEYIYGVYDNTAEGNKTIRKNDSPNKEKYEYIKYDRNSGKQGQYEMSTSEDKEINE